jgi:hypothetical protein
LSERVLLACRLSVKDTDKCFAFSCHSQLSEALCLGSIALQTNNEKGVINACAACCVRSASLTAVEPDSRPAVGMRRDDCREVGMRDKGRRRKSKRTGFDDIDDLEGGRIVAASELHDGFASCVEDHVKPIIGCNNKGVG